MVFKAGSDHVLSIPAVAEPSTMPLELPPDEFASSDSSFASPQQKGSVPRLGDLVGIVSCRVRTYSSMLKSISTETSDELPSIWPQTCISLT